MGLVGDPCCGRRPVPGQAAGTSAHAVCFGAGDTRGFSCRQVIPAMANGLSGSDPRAAVIALRYAIFAVIATAANIGAQHLCLLAYAGAYSFPLSLAFGTGVGLVTKYLLDKRWIFGFRARDARHDAGTFVLYTGTGVVTTCIFWGSEYLFDLLSGTLAGRYAGGVIGLGIGYVIKYRLDRRYVFGSAG